MPSALYPIIGYADARAAIEFLCTAFGFTRHTVMDGGDGLVLHAELRLGPGVIVMVGSVQYDTLGMRVPDDVGGHTGGVYVAVDDIEAHYARSQLAGARIVQELVDQGAFGLRYTALDTEGHLWGFGTYRPQESPTVA